MEKIYWLTGQSGAGKTTIARILQKEIDCVVLDGDEMRECISLNAGFSREERRNHNIRVARLAKVLSRQKIVLVSVIAPMKEVRKEIEKICDPVWVYIKRALPEREGHFYEEPEGYFVVDHDKLSIEESVRKIRAIIKQPQQAWRGGTGEKKHKEIICTLGPASMDKYTITRLEGLGVNLFRINLSHTKLEDLAGAIRFVQNLTEIPICLDTEGAQIRTGNLKEKSIFLQSNAVVRVPIEPLDGCAEKFNLYPYDSIKYLVPGDIISIDFNSVLAQVIEKSPKYVILRILTSGKISSNKAVSVIREFALPPLTEKDRKALLIGLKMGIKYVALSFANQPEDVNEIRRIVSKDTKIISKIESIKGVMNFREIAKKSYALLLDRGDLSRQVPIEQIPQVQKHIMQELRGSGTKIFIATNLLESMITSLTPTRAEVNDVFNTLNDGADGLVLAAETAIGSYPINCTAMISRIIREFHNSAAPFSIGNVKKSVRLLLSEPHGGVLVNSTNYNLKDKEIKKYKKLEVDKTILMDVEQMAVGTFSPLTGFLDKKNLETVINDYRLADGTIWPLPIMLQTTREQALRLKGQDRIALVLSGTPDVYAVLDLEDIYTYDLDKIAKKTYGTISIEHPGVRLLKSRGKYFLGGKIELIKRLPAKHKYFEITPGEARLIFEYKGWSRVVGFHTRNVMHRAHEYIQTCALENYHCDGIFVHPVVGPKKDGDYDAGIILKSYEMMILAGYLKSKIFLGAFQNYSRYCGPREAVFTALCRKNFGCSHFIVGRDHTGLGDYYKPGSVVKLFERLGDIGITPIFFDDVHYCKKCGTYLSRCNHGRTSIMSISGSEGRAMLKSGMNPPEWFIRKEISKFILDEIKNNNKVFVNGELGG